MPIEPEALPNRHIEVSEEFLQQNEEFLVFLCRALGQVALDTSGVIDFDVREALDAAIRTEKTMQTGLVYESLPANPLAASVCRALLDAAKEFRQGEFERLGFHKTKESVVLGLLIFLQRFEFSLNNGRKRGRAFIDALLDFYPAEAGADGLPSTSIIVP